MQTILIIGRILFGGFFLFNGLNHFRNLNSLRQYAASKKVPAPKLATMLTGLLLLVGGLGVMFNLYLDMALWLLVLFLIPTTIIMHTFWKETDPNAKMLEMNAFLKNMALAGAALMFLAI